MQNSVFGLIIELNGDTLTEICGMLKLDENAVSAKQGEWVALHKITLRYLTSVEEST